MARKSLKELSRLYDEGKIPTLQYIRSLESQVRQANAAAEPRPSMSDKERIAAAREYVCAEQARDYAAEQLGEAVQLSYPTDSTEALALSGHLADIRAAQKRMDACLENLS